MAKLLAAPCVILALQVVGAGAVRSQELEGELAQEQEQAGPPPAGVSACYEAFEAAFARVDRDAADFAALVSSALAADRGLDAAACIEALKGRLRPAAKLASGGGYGANALTGWEYTLVDDCFRGGPCTTGQYCQVSYREQWFPFAEAFINRGRCVPFRQVGQVCSGDYGATIFDTEYTSWITPPGLCADGLKCAQKDTMPAIPGPMCVNKADSSVVLPPYMQEGQPCSGDFAAGKPGTGLCATGLACAKDMVPLPGPMCVRTKSLEMPCDSVWPKCAGAAPPSNVKGTTTLDWGDIHCNSNKTCATVKTGGFSRQQLEQCVAESFMHLSGAQEILIPKAEEVARVGLASRTSGAVGDHGASFDSAGGAVASKDLEEMGGMGMSFDIGHKDAMEAYVHAALKPLWPYPICDKTKTSDCTAWPPTKDAAVADTAIGKHISGYNCLWGVVHTVIENGAEDLTSEQMEASRHLVNMFRYGHSCKICRTNFAHLVDKLGFPQGAKREAHANWWWQAHNNANEHVWSVHSIGSPLGPRVGDWANPVYLNPWYTSREVAKQTWKIKR